MRDRPVNHRFLNRADRFVNDRRGNFGMMFGITGLMLVTATGMSLDMARMFSAQTRLNMAVDAAVLSTTRNITLGNISEDDAPRVVANYVEANIDKGDFFGSPVRIDDVRIDRAAQTLAVDASINLPMTISKIVGVEKRRVAAASAARYSNMKIEVAMALDITGSMNNTLPGTSTTRIAALRAAAKLGIGRLMDANRAVERVRVGLVPYARSVDASPVIGRIRTSGPAPDGCVIERSGPQAHTDRFATASHPLDPALDADHCPKSEILPMTADERALDRHNDTLRTGGWTAGHIAVGWTQYMLSSNWNRAWPKASHVAADGDPGTRKVAIIMTDGRFNTFDSAGRRPDDRRSVRRSRNTALSICSEMKSRGIAVYTIAFSAGADAVQLMRDCATPDDARISGSCTSPGSADRQFAFSAENQRELEDAFKAIADDITCLRLTG